MSTKGRPKTFYDLPEADLSRKHESWKLQKDSWFYFVFSPAQLNLLFCLTGVISCFRDGSLFSVRRSNGICGSLQTAWPS
jgi:hypothetical protein